MKFDVYYVERVVKRITIEAEDRLEAGRAVIMERNDINYKKSKLIDSTIWAIDKVVEVKK